jgi:hypothetical protein
MEVLNERFGSCHAKKKVTAKTAKMTGNGRASIHPNISLKDRRMETPFVLRVTGCGLRGYAFRILLPPFLLPPLLYPAFSLIEKKTLSIKFHMF